MNSASEAHDVYLQMLAEGGILGLVAIVGVVIAAVRDLVRSFAAQRPWVAGAAGALLASVVAWTTDYQLRLEPVSAMVAVILGLVAALHDRDPSSPSLGTAP